MARLLYVLDLTSEIGLCYPATMPYVKSARLDEIKRLAAESKIEMLEVRDRLLAIANDMAILYESKTEVGLDVLELWIEELRETADRIDK